MTILKKTLDAALRQFGWELRRLRTTMTEDAVADLTDQERGIVHFAAPITMTSTARMASLINATKYIVEKRIGGAVVECGVWRGGSMVVAARTLMLCKEITRDLYLYDTFEGMVSPSESDRSWTGELAQAQLDRTRKGTGVWCYASLNDVRQNMEATGYPMERVNFIQGPIEQTVPEKLPGQIALLRLDTDWYASTKHELVHMFPLLVSGGMLIIDDYGHWRGARKAVDEYLGELGIDAYLHRVDYTCRLLIKP